MKTLITLPAIAIAAWLVAAPAHTTPAIRTSLQTPENALEEHEARTERAFGALREHVKQKNATHTEFEALRTALREQAEALEATHPRAKALRERLAAVIDELEERAKSAALEADVLERLHEDLIEARLDRALDWLQRQALKRDATRTDYERVARALGERAENAKAKDGDTGNERERFTKLVDDLEARGKTYVLAESDFAPLRAALIDARLNRAMAWLEDQAVARNASRADFERVSRLLAERAEAAKATEPDAVEKTQRLQKALAKLEERAANAAITREEFQQLKDQLFKKAREAGAPPKR